MEFAGSEKTESIDLIKKTLSALEENCRYNFRYRKGFNGRQY